MRTHLFRGGLALAVILIISAAPALAQSITEGKVVDGEGKPVEGATIVFESTGTSAKITTRTNRAGEFFQLGLPSGQYNVTASKEGVGTQTLPVNVRQARNEPMSFTLTPVRVPAAGAKPENPEAAAVQAAASAALDAMRAGQYDTAIARFNEVIEKVPACAECFLNLGLAYTSKQQYPEAETAFKKAVELDPKSGDAYTGLANIYNAQRRFTEAAEASAKASEISNEGGGGLGANASAIYNQGVILWNAGKFDEAKVQFEAAVKADPRMAMAHYQLGMANLNLGEIAAAREAFQKYLEVDPDGPKSAEVKAFVEQLPK